MKLLKNTFRPEFINRIDEIIVFHKLKNSELKSIIKLMLNEVKKRLEQHKIFVKYDENIYEYILSKIKDQDFRSTTIKKNNTIRNRR